MLQSIFTLCILFVGVFTLLPGIFSDNFNKKILSKYASGYNLYKWVNESLPKNSLIITNHRSTYFAEHQVIFFEMASHLDNSDLFSRNYFLEEIKKKNQILFYFTVMTIILSIIHLIFTNVLMVYFLKK